MNANLHVIREAYVIQLLDTGVYSDDTKGHLSQYLLS